MSIYKTIDERGTAEAAEQEEDENLMATDDIINRGRDTDPSLNK